MFNCLDKTPVSWIQIVFFFFPSLVLIASSLLPYKSIRADDVIGILMLLIIIYLLILQFLMSGKCKIYNCKWMMTYSMVIIPTVILIIDRGDGVNGLEFALFFLALFLMPAIAFLNAPRSSYGLLPIVKGSLILYLLLIVSLMGVSKFDNDRFLQLTALNINNAMLPVLPSVGWWARSTVGKKWRKDDVLIALLFLLAILLTGSKLTIILGIMLILVAMRIQFDIKRLSFFCFVIFAFMLSVPEGSWLSNRIQQLGNMLVGNWMEVPSLINRLMLWSVYLDAYFEKPLLGYGMGNTHEAFLSSVLLMDLENQFMGNIHTPHNSYLRLLIEGGGVLFSGIVLLHLTFIMKIIKSYRRLKAIDLMSMLLASILINAFFTEALYSWTYWASFAQMALFYWVGDFARVHVYKGWGG